MRHTLNMLNGLALLGIALTVVTAGCAKPGTRPLTPPANARPFGKMILVPIGTMDRGYLQQLSRYYKEKLSLDIPVSEPIPDFDLDAAHRAYPEKVGPVWDAQRKQYQVQNVVKSLAYFMDPESTDTRTISANLRKYRVVVAVVNKDMYDAEVPGNNFIFAASVKPDTPAIPMRLAVVSLARFDPSFFGQRHDGKLVKERLRKFVTQKIGELYYGLPRNDDSGSVLYRGTDNLTALDRVGEGY
jgi:predicted Zn-dependent protease